MVMNVILVGILLFAIVLMFLMTQIIVEMFQIICENDLEGEAKERLNQFEKTLEFLSNKFCK
jgi:hypothetical protein